MNFSGWKMTTSSRFKARNWAREIVRGDFRVLDMETTGLDGNAEPVQIAVIDQDGQPLLNTLVRPTTVTIEPEAAGVHGITAEMVAESPAFADVWGQLLDVLGGVNENGHPNTNMPVVIYNARFEERVLRHMVLDILGHPLPAFNWQCAMNQYARFYGDWNSYRRSYRWQSLGNACVQQGIKVNARGHSALGDCLRTLALVRAMAAWQPETQQS